MPGGKIRVVVAKPGLDGHDRGAKIASLFGVSATASATVAPGHVQVNLGATARVPGASASASPSNSATALPTTGAQGGAVIAKNGIPCVD